MSFDPILLGNKLKTAIENNETIDALIESDMPSNLDDAYAIQDHIFEGLGKPSCGWKVGLGNKTGMRAFNLPSPAAARMFQDSIYQAGDTITFDPFAPLVVEFEVIYKISKDVSPKDQIQNVMDIVESTHLGFELIQAHLPNWKTQGALNFIAEGIGFAALVTDHAPMAISHADLLKSIAVYCDGELKAEAATGDDGLDPIEMLEFLVGHCQKYGHTLNKGDLVSSGTQTAQFVVPIGDHHIEAKWNGGMMDFKMTSR